MNATPFNMIRSHESNTVREALQRIEQRQLRMPAIQREFVWRQRQIENLFDSLTRGFPIGSFLFWNVEPTTVGQFQFYGFIRDFHRRDHAQAPKDDPIPGQGLTAVLDGQQRLTAMHIGLRGSYAEKKPHLWWSNDAAFPESRLYLDLHYEPTRTQGEDESESEHPFKFLTESELNLADEGRWFLCAESSKSAMSRPSKTRS